MSKQRIDVFVSSTMEDLKDHRAAVRDEILTFPECRPIMMEYFPAMDANAVKVCLDGVDDSKIYIGIYAYRYGFCPQDSEISITEMEFNQATKNGIPRLCFLVDPKFDGWDEKSKDDEPNKTRLSNFKRRIDASMVRATFTTPDSLAKAVGRALRATLPAILTHEENEPPPFPCQRIPKPAIFAGRAKELDDLKKALDGDQPVAITALRGVGGIGKTTLAQQVAEELGDKFDLKLYATLGEKFDESRLPTILRDWSQQDFPQDAKIEQMIAITKNVLTNTECGENVLALIDDVWPDTVSVARSLKTSLPNGARILITTRNTAVAGKLDVQGAGLIRLQHMPPNEGADLMLAYLPAFAVDHRAKLEELSAVLGGHPTALKLAARLLQQRFTLTELNNTITTLREGLAAGDSFENLELGEDESDQKDDSVSVTLKLTLDRLGGKDAKLNPLRQKQFRALGALPPDIPFSDAHIAALWEGEDSKTLREFVSEGLLDDAPHPEKAPENIEWYTQHRLLRAYARGLAREANELDAFFNRYADAVIEVAGQFRILPPEAWGALEADLPHVQVVGDTLVTLHKATLDDTDLQTRALNFAYNITRYLFNRREVRRVEWLEMGLSVSQANGQQQRELLFLNELGLMWNALGEKRKALDFYEQALPLMRDVGDRAGEAVTLNNMGLVWDDLGEKRKALDFYEQALPLQRAVGDRAGEAVTLINMGLVWSDLGEKRKALDFYEQALPLTQAIGDRGGEAATLNNMGAVWSDLGEKRKALDFFEQALPLRRAVGDRSGEATTLNNIAAIHFSSGELNKTLEILKETITAYQAIGEAPKEVGTRFNLAVVLQQLNRIDEAVDHMRQSIVILQKYNLPQAAGGLSFAQVEAFLQQLEYQRDGIPEPEQQPSQQEKVIIMLVNIYREKGADAVRTLLQEQTDLEAEQIDDLLAQIAQAAGQ